MKFSILKISLFFFQKSEIDVIKSDLTTVVTQLDRQWVTDSDGPSDELRPSDSRRESHCEIDLTSDLTRHGSHRRWITRWVSPWLSWVTQAESDSLSQTESRESRDCNWFKFGAPTKGGWIHSFVLIFLFFILFKSENILFFFSIYLVCLRLIQWIRMREKEDDKRPTCRESVLFFVDFVYFIF